MPNFQLTFITSMLGGEYPQRHVQDGRDLDEGAAVLANQGRAGNPPCEQLTII